MGEAIAWPKFICAKVATRFARRVNQKCETLWLASKNFSFISLSPSPPSASSPQHLLVFGNVLVLVLCSVYPFDPIALPLHFLAYQFHSENNVLV